MIVLMVLRLVEGLKVDGLMVLKLTVKCIHFMNKTEHFSPYILPHLKRHTLLFLAPKSVHE